MTTPTDEQISALRLAVGAGAYEALENGGNGDEVRDAGLRAAWHHVARQIMSIQVGDRVRVIPGDSLSGSEGVVVCGDLDISVWFDGWENSEMISKKRITAITDDAIEGASND